MGIPLHQVGFEKITVERVIDFLPYPFLVAEVKDDRPTTVFVNQKFREEIGFDIDDIPTIDEWFQKAYPRPEYRTEVKKAWDERAEYALKNKLNSVSMAASVTTKHGTHIWYDIKSSFIGPLHLVAFVNIDDNTRKEQELQRLNENKNRILSILSHDLRNPLGNLQTLIEMMLTQSLSEGDFIKNVKTLSSKIFQLAEFVDTTLHWTKSNFDEFNVTIESVDLMKIATSLLPIYESAYRLKNITVTLTNSLNEPVSTDPEIMTIVMRNLLSNAIKFTPDNGAINISARKNRQVVSFAVTDNGIGMSSETIGNILNDRYTSNRGTREEKGLGIGLKLCRDLLKRVRSELRIESEVGRGTSVEIVIKT